MYQEVHTQNIADRAHASEIPVLLARFARLGVGKGGAPYEALNAELMRDFADDLMVLAPTAANDFVYLHYGRELIRNVGCNRIGERVSRMMPQVAGFTCDSYDLALAEGQPVYTIHRSLRQLKASLWERLILPTTAADGARYIIAFSRPLEFREQLLATVLDTSPSGIVALRAIRDEDGRIERVAIRTANRRAVALAGAPGGILLNREAREGLPFLAVPTTWQRCLYAIELRRDDRFEIGHEHEGGERWLQVALAPLHDGAVMTLTDISELKRANQALQSRAATLALEIGRERATRRALCQEIDQREERERELRRLAETDPLTALLNRRSFHDKAQDAIARCQAARAPLSLVVVDLDHFKSVNDSHGHAAGDAVIRAFADLLLGTARNEIDLVGRFGGEEFVILMPRADAAAAEALALRVRGALATRRLPVSETLALQVSASFGVAMLQRGESFGELMARADGALYRAKNEGRDCVRVAEARTAARATAAA